MLKLIILNSNIEAIKKVCNSIINEIPDIQLSGIATNQNEFNKLMDKINPDLLIMNYSDFINSKYHDDIKILKVLFCNVEKIQQTKNNKLFLPENIDIISIQKAIKEFISKQNKDLIRKKIIHILESFCFDFKLIGTTYLLESILYCYENKTDYVFENLERKVYPEIANTCKASVNNIKFSIVRAINSMHCNITPSAQKQLSDNFKVDISEKTTAKQLISTIVTKL